MKKIFLCIVLTAILLKPSLSQKYTPGDHELLLMPTASTMEKGSYYFSDYELFFLNFTFAPGPNTHLGAFTLFPVTTDFLETFSVGFKHRFINTTDFSSAVWGSYTPKSSTFVLGNVLSINTDRPGFHLGLAAANQLDGDSHTEVLIMAGTDIELSEKFILLLEYTNLSSFIENDVNGLISFGVRFRGNDIAWELGGLRPLEDTGDEFLFFPLLKATILFK